MAHVITKYIVYNHNNGTGVKHRHFNASNNITSATDENYQAPPTITPVQALPMDGPHYGLEGIIFHLLLCQ